MTAKKLCSYPTCHSAPGAGEESNGGNPRNMYIFQLPHQGPDRHAPAYRYRGLLRRRRRALLSDHLRGRCRLLGRPMRIPRSRCIRPPSPTTCMHRPRRLAGRGRADARLRREAGEDRRRLPDLPGQHHPSGAAAMSNRDRPCPGCISPRSSPPRRSARGFRRLGLTGTRWLVESEVYPEKLTARGSTIVAPEPCRARGDQPHHHGRAGLRGLQTRGGRLLSAGHRRG